MLRRVTLLVIAAELYARLFRAMLADYALLLTIAAVSLRAAV